jgi:hypothetical protein
MSKMFKFELKNVSYSAESLSLHIDKSVLDTLMSMTKSAIPDDVDAPPNLVELFGGSMYEGASPEPIQEPAPEPIQDAAPQAEAEPEIEYITLSQYDQLDMPDAYGGSQPVVFRKPTHEEVVQAEQVFSGFLISWCRGWGRDPVDRVKLINHRMKESNQRFALYLKWWFYQMGSMQAAIHAELERIATTPMWHHCFDSSTPFSSGLVIDVANNMCQIFSSALPDLNVFFSHKWGLPNTLFEPEEHGIPDPYQGTNGGGII